MVETGCFLVPQDLDRPQNPESAALMADTAEVCEHGLPGTGKGFVPVVLFVFATRGNGASFCPF